MKTVLAQTSGLAVSAAIIRAVSHSPAAGLASGCSQKPVGRDDPGDLRQAVGGHVGGELGDQVLAVELLALAAFAPGTQARPCR